MLRVAAGCLLVFLMGGAQVVGAEQAMGPRSVEEIEKIVREYLLDNPEVIFEAVQRHRERQRRQQAVRDRAAIQTHRQALLADPDSFVGGNPDGRRDPGRVLRLPLRLLQAVRVHPGDGHEARPPSAGSLQGIPGAG